jgi:hypothetical protein
MLYFVSCSSPKIETSQLANSENDGNSLKKPSEEASNKKKEPPPKKAGAGSPGGLESLLGGAGGGGAGAGGGGAGAGGDGAGAGGSGDASQIAWDTRFKEPFRTTFLNPPLGNYLIGSDSQAGLPASYFNCPGDSILVGLMSSFDKIKNDRLYKPMCQFFADGSGKPIRRTTCISEESKTTVQSSFDFKCSDPNMVISGIKAVYDATTHDRFFNFTCCNVIRDDGMQLFLNDNPTLKACFQRVTRGMVGQDQTDLINDQINAVHTGLNFTCPENMTIYRFITEYVPPSTGTAFIHVQDTGDRRFSFRCCSLLNNEVMSKQTAEPP